jgi:hypothetical protein
VEGTLGNDPYSKATARMSFERFGKMTSTLSAISGVQKTSFAPEILIQ